MKRTALEFLSLYVPVLAVYSIQKSSETKWSFGYASFLVIAGIIGTIASMGIGLVINYTVDKVRPKKDDKNVKD